MRHTLRKGRVGFRYVGGVSDSRVVQSQCGSCLLLRRSDATWSHSPPQQRRHNTHDWETWSKFTPTFDEGHPKNGADLPENEAIPHRRISVTDKYAKSVGFWRGIPEYVRSFCCCELNSRNQRRRRRPRKKKKKQTWLLLLVPRKVRRWRGSVAAEWRFFPGRNRCSPCCGNSFGCWFRSSTTPSCPVRKYN